jgi:hypothetical protein
LWNTDHGDPTPVVALFMDAVAITAPFHEGGFHAW